MFFRDPFLFFSVRIVTGKVVVFSLRHHCVSCPERATKTALFNGDIAVFPAAIIPQKEGVFHQDIAACPAGILPPNQVIFRPKHDIFQTITTWFWCLNLPHVYHSVV